MAVSWIVVKTESRGEEKAAGHIQRQGCETYSPRMKERIRLSPGTYMWRESVMFPRYLFVFVLDQWRFLLSTIGVMGVIRRGGMHEPAVLADNVVSYFRSQESTDGTIVITEKGFRIGQRVRLREGCMVGSVGIYQGASSLERENVLFTLLGRQTRVSVSAGSLIAA